MSGYSIEKAYWKFDAMRRGYGEWSNTPKSERDAFKSACAFVVESENVQLKELIARLQLEAKIHAQEARTANATIAEIYQVVSGATGEQGNWNGVQPVKALVDQLKNELAQATQREARLRACLQKGLGPFVDDPGGYEAWYGEATVLVQEAGT